MGKLTKEEFYLLQHIFEYTYTFNTELAQKLIDKGCIKHEVTNAYTITQLGKEIYEQEDEFHWNEKLNQSKDVLEDLYDEIQ